MLGSIRFIFRLGALTLACSVFGAEIELLKVDFSLIDQPGGSDPWYEVSVALSVESGEPAPGSNPRFADEISVSLALATEADRSDGVDYAFYSAVATFPALEVGRHFVRFYLPPELVKRDRVRGDPFAFEILAIQGEKELASLVSRNLEAASALEAFHARIEREQSGEGILRLQQETPFALLFVRDTPNPRLRLSLP